MPTDAFFCPCVQLCPGPAPNGGGSGSSGGGGGRGASSLLRHLPPAARQADASRLRRVGSLWTGVGATLARDVPFSALYWGMVEPIRGGLRAARRAGAGRETELEVLAINVTGEQSSVNQSW